VDTPRVSQRFKAGGVTFCTLLPLRAIPFEVVCLLGMNDGDYPRPGSRFDFDLMALPGQARPGDRSRRDDDRQLMLDALLSARRVLYISWAGRSQRDNQEQPPSVLVSQLRDYLASGWGDGVVDRRTTEHPLQPFSRRYFEPVVDGAAQALFTYASEWRAAHTEPASPGRSTRAAPEARNATAFTVQGLAAFLRNPVKAFFRHRLLITFDGLASGSEDDEPFTDQGLDRWTWVDEILRECRREFDAPSVEASPEWVQSVLHRQVGRLVRAGRLPMGAPGRRVEGELMAALQPLVGAWQAALASYPKARDKLPLRLAHAPGSRWTFDDWLVGLRAVGDRTRPVWIELQASKVADPGTSKSGPVLRVDRLLPAWVRCLASAACGSPADGIVMGEGAVVHVTAPEPSHALPLLTDLLQACSAALDGDRPLPTAVRTGATWLTRPEVARQAYEGAYRSQVPGEGREACLARLYPDFAALSAEPDFDSASRRLYEPYLQWLADHATARILSAAPAAQGTGDE
jgi:exodeoxyribonuclease V gamma subunit